MSHITNSKGSLDRVGSLKNRLDCFFYEITIPILFNPSIAKLRMKFELPDIPEEEQTPVVKGLLTIIEQLIEHTQKQQEEIAILKDEVRELKGEKKRPKFKGSKLDESTNDETSDAEKKNKKQKKRSRKKKQLSIHTEKVIKPDNLPAGSRFKGYQDFIVQELVIHNKNIRYRLERWLTPDGTLITGSLPASLDNRHYGPNLLTYLLYQHHHCQVTQPLLLEQLREWGIVISSGQLNRLLCERKERFHDEKDALLVTGLTESGYVTVDDSGARHKGKNGYVTHIGNDFFAWFSSTESKSRANFLSLLHGGKSCYLLSEEAFSYMHEHKLPQAQLAKLKDLSITDFSCEASWTKQLESLDIKGKRHIKIATEGALFAALLNKQDLNHLAIISDGAGQFDVLEHGLCWVHAERLIHTMIPLNDKHREEIKEIRAQIWTLYKNLKSYKLSPDTKQAEVLSLQFDQIFQQQTSYITLNKCLERLAKHKDKLLLVLKRPDVPLHTNGSESDIRDYVKKRKVSGGTRSDLGRKCRDTFISLKKTCRKLKISFWDYLHDRHYHSQIFPPLPEIVRFRLSESRAATSL